MEESNKKPKAQQCAEEVEAILKKYNCQIVVQQQTFYGQVVYAPFFVEIQKASS